MKITVVKISRCWNGHPLFNGNVYLSGGKRRCRECRLRWGRLQAWRKKYNDTKTIIYAK